MCHVMNFSSLLKLLQLLFQLSVKTYLFIFMLYFQQLDVITPFQIYFNPDLIFKHYQVTTLKYTIVILNIWTEVLEQIEWHRAHWYQRRSLLTVKFLL